MGHDNYKQAVSVSRHMGGVFHKKIDVAHTLLARDYKGLGNLQPSNGVINGKY